MRSAFTLIELLVVVTIIIVLLALLTPALDKAIYQAEMAVCGANLKGIGTGVTVYAAGNRRAYPDRPLMPQPAWLGSGGDARPILRLTLGNINGILYCPLAGKVDYDKARATEIFSSYNLWFDWKYDREKGMFKLGDKFTYRGREFGYLASDRDLAFGTNCQSSHPDFTERVMANEVLQDAPNPFQAGSPTQGTITIALWVNRSTPSRGPTDDHFLRTDGSVRRIHGIEWNQNGDGITKVGVIREGTDGIFMPTD